MKRPFSSIALAGAIAVALPACFAAGAANAFDLTILHINDHHSHLRTDDKAVLKLGGKPTRIDMGGFPRVVTLFKERAPQAKNLLKLHAGDAVTGDLYYTLFKGEADADMMNVICFDAFELGNHEFDDGDKGLKTFIDFLWKGECKTPVLGANVVPEVGVSPLTQKTATDYIRPYVIKEVGGQRIGIIGLDTAKKTKGSSNPDETTMFLDETETATRYVAELTKMGVKHIILLTHQTYANDKTLAKAVPGVDIIVGGDSHSLLGDFKSLGLNPEGPYPTRIDQGSGKAACVVQAWQYSAVVGELKVTFDDNGDVTACAGTPHISMGERFRRKGPDGKWKEVTDAERAAILKDIDARADLSVTPDDPGAAKILAGYSARVDELKGQVVGQVSEMLCLERVPGQGVSAKCDVSKTREHGSDIGNLVAFAYRNMSKTSQIAIQNAGGVRVDVPAGPFTIGDAYTLLPFANSLIEFDMSGAEIHAVLEDALDYALSPGGSTGAYPYAAGLRWRIDATKPKGQRFSGFEFQDKGQKAWVPLDMAKTYKVVTNSFLAGGRDGYATFKKVADAGRSLDTYLDYAQSFADYVKERGTVGKLPAGTYSTQSFKR